MIGLEGISKRFYQGKTVQGSVIHSLTVHFYLLYPAVKIPRQFLEKDEP